MHRGTSKDLLLVAVICFELLLQPQDLLVALVQAPREPRHDVPLLHQQALVAVHLPIPYISEAAFLQPRSTSCTRISSRYTDPQPQTQHVALGAVTADSLSGHLPHMKDQIVFPAAP